MLSIMHFSFSFADGLAGRQEAQPFILMRDHILPALETRRAAFGVMYADVLGRPEVDPVFLAGFTILQMMQRLPDRAAVAACLYDVRWRLGLDLSSAWKPVHPTTLVHFRERLARHGGAKLALEAGLEAMRHAGYLNGYRAVRIDSTHALGQIAAMSRLECMRETLRLALEFLAGFGGPEWWEPWHSRYADRHPDELRHASEDRLRTTFAQAGFDAREVLGRAAQWGSVVTDANPVALLRRVYDEQFEQQDGTPRQRRAAPAGAVQNPHDPESSWCTKRSLGKTGWVGYKAQVCETVPEQPRQRGEPTEAVITAIVTQPANTNDASSLKPVLTTHVATTRTHPETIFADAGYVNAPALEQAETAGYELCGPIGAPPHSGTRFGSDSFVVDIANRRATCPNGKTSCECDRIAESARSDVYYYFAWSRADCTTCPLAVQCLSKRTHQPRRTLQVGEEHMRVQARRLLCRTPEYRHRMCRRSGIESTHSELKRGYGIRRCRYRGRAKTDLQMQFAGAACNLRRWANRWCWMSQNSR